MAYKNYNLQITPKFDTEVLANSLNAMEQKHEATLEKASAIKAAIAKLPLNEAESEWRNQLVQSVENTLNANDINGFKGYGYDDILKLSGDISGNKDLYGKLKANEKYTKFVDAIDTSDLPEQYKQYYREKNPYYYNANEGGDWKPFEMATAPTDTAKLQAFILQHVKPKTRTGEVIRYQDANGNITENPMNGNAVWYNTTTSQVTQINRQELVDAMNSLINNDPTISNGLLQDFKIAKWAMKNGKEPLFKIMSNHNGTMTFNQFKEEMFKDFYDAYSKPEVQSVTKVNPNFARDMKLLRESSQREVALSRDMTGGIGTSNAPSSTLTVNTGKETINHITNGNTDLANRIQALLPTSKVDSRKINITNLDSTKDYLQSLGLEDNQIDSILKSYNDKYAEDIRYYNQHFTDLDDKSTCAALMKDIIANNGDFSEDFLKSKWGGRYADEWNKIGDAYYGNNDVLVAAFNNDKDYNKFNSLLENLNIPSDAIQYVNIEGKKGIGLNKEFMSYLPQFAEGINQVYKDMNFWRKAGSFLGAISYPSRNGFRRYRTLGNEPVPQEKGNRSTTSIGIYSYDRYTEKYALINRDNVADAGLASKKIFGKTLQDIGTIGTITYPLVNDTGMVMTPNEIFRPVKRFMERLDKNAEPSMIDQTVVMSSHKLDVASPVGLGYRSMELSLNPNDKEERTAINEYIKLREEDEKSIRKSIPGSFSGSSIYMFDESGKMLKVDSDVVSLLNISINNDDLKDSDISLALNWEQKGYLTQFTVKADKAMAKLLNVDEGEVLTIQTDGVNKEQISEFNQNPILKTYMKIATNFAEQKDISIPNFGNEGNLWLHSNNAKSMSIIQQKDNGFENTIQELNFGTDNSGELYSQYIDSEDFSHAMNLYDLKNQMNSLRDSYIVYGDSLGNDDNFINTISIAYNTYKYYFCLLNNINPNIEGLDNIVKQAFQNETNIPIN